jgi:hypothetical protein
MIRNSPWIICMLLYYSFNYCLSNISKWNYNTDHKKTIWLSGAVDKIEHVSPRRSQTTQLLTWSTLLNTLGGRYTNYSAPLHPRAQLEQTAMEIKRSNAIKIRMNLVWKECLEPMVYTWSNKQNVMYWWESKLPTLCDWGQRKEVSMEIYPHF